MTPQELSRRGEEARILLESPLLAESFKLIEQEVAEQWQNSKASDQDGREKLWLTLRLLKRVEAQLRLTVETGKVAKATLLQRAADEARAAGQRLFRR